EGNAKDHDCLIEGWNGTYISAMPGWNGNLDLSSIVVDAGDADIQIPTYEVRVSDDFASADIHLRKHRSHAGNPISALGTYIICFVQDSDGRMSVLVDRRGNTPLYPHKWNGTGTAIPADEKEKYVAAVAQRTAKKYCLDIDPAQVHPLGILLDNVYNITLPSGWTVLSEKQAEKTKLRRIALPDFPEFIAEEAPIEEWNFPGFMGICAAIDQLETKGYGIGRSYGVLGRTALNGEYGRLEHSPLKVQSALQIIEKDIIDKGRSLTEYYAHLVSLPEQTL
ncbi:hypothetical protein KY363_03585, partial [Candidatus Woesearchaeota archaeon]|nr:hypothetical protein [Candidatus Woesearchaeota archaeon]